MEGCTLLFLQPEGMLPCLFAKRPAADAGVGIQKMHMCLDRWLVSRSVSSHIFLYMMPRFSKRKRSNVADGCLIELAAVQRAVHGAESDGERK